jgi:hypothetical protein
LLALSFSFSLYRTLLFTDSDFFSSLLACLAAVDVH